MRVGFKQVLSHREHSYTGDTVGVGRGDSWEEGLGRGVIWSIEAMVWEPLYREFLREVPVCFTL